MSRERKKKGAGSDPVGDAGGEGEDRKDEASTGAPERPRRGLRRSRPISVIPEIADIDKAAEHRRRFFTRPSSGEASSVQSASALRRRWRWFRARSEARPPSDLTDTEARAEAARSAAAELRSRLKQEGGSRVPAQSSTREAGKSGGGAAEGAGASRSEPPAGSSRSEPPAGGSRSEPFAGSSRSEPPAGASRSEPPAGSSRSEPPAGGLRSDPSAGSSRSEPPAGGSRSEPFAGSSRSEPPAGGLRSDSSAGVSRSDPSTGSSRPDPSAGSSRPDPSAGSSRPEPSAGSSRSDPSAGSSRSDPSAGSSRSDPSAGSSRPDPSAGSSRPPAPHAEQAGRGARAAPATHSQDARTPPSGSAAGRGARAGSVIVPVSDSMIVSGSISSPRAERTARAPSSGEPATDDPATGDRTTGDPAADRTARAESAPARRRRATSTQSGRAAPSPARESPLRRWGRPLTELSRPQSWQRHDFVVVAVALALFATGVILQRRLATPSLLPMNQLGLQLSRPAGWLPPRRVGRPAGGLATPVDADEDSAPGGSASDEDAAAGVPYHIVIQSVLDSAVRLEIRIVARPATGNLRSALVLERVARHGEAHWAADSTDRTIGGRDWVRTEYRYAYKGSKTDAPRIATGVEYATVNGRLLYIVTLHGNDDTARRLESVLVPTLSVDANHPAAVGAR